MKFALLLTFAIFSFAGCQNAATKNTDSGVPNVASDVKEVSPADAQTAVSKAYSQFIDVRTVEEYSGVALRPTFKDMIGLGPSASWPQVNVLH